MHGCTYTWKTRLEIGGRHLTVEIRLLRVPSHPTKYPYRQFTTGVQSLLRPMGSPDTSAAPNLHPIPQPTPLSYAISKLPYALYLGFITRLTSKCLAWPFRYSARGSGDGDGDHFAIPQTGDVACAGEVEKERGDVGEVEMHGGSVRVRGALKATYQQDISSRWLKGLTCGGRRSM